MDSNLKPKVFIASPLFNPPQIAIIERIEDLLNARGFSFYSARLHSGSDLLSPEERRDIRKWDPVFDSNEHGLDECRVCIAVLEYPLPANQQLTRATFTTEGGWAHIPTELPDAGTVWEMGYLRAQNKMVIGFHSTKRAQHLNLMLSHGCDALISGWENLARFLTQPPMEGQQISCWPPRLVDRCRRVDPSIGYQLSVDAARFDWSSTEDWDSATKAVE